MRHNPGLTVTFRGVRGSIPTPAQQNLAFGGNTTCLEVRSGDGDLLMIDAGSGARQLGLELVDEFAGRSLDLHVLFTHFHWDHIQGLPFFAPLEGAANRVTFHSTRPAGELREILSGQMHKPYYPISFDDMSARREFAQMDDRASVPGHNNLGTGNCTANEIVALHGCARRTSANDTAPLQHRTRSHDEAGLTFGQIEGVSKLPANILIGSGYIHRVKPVEKPGRGRRSGRRGLRCLRTAGSGRR